MNAESLLKSGDLEECKNQLFSEIRKDPSNPDLRIFLFQLSCINQDWDKALTQLDVVNDLSPDAAPMVNTYKQLIECEQIRQKVLSGEKEPVCFGEPSDWLAYYVKAFAKTVSGDFEQAKSLIEEGAAQAPEIAGSINNEHAFNWLSDGDVRFGPSIEVILNGGYYWLPYEYIASLEFEPVEDLRDLVWRPANLTLKNKGKLIVFVPSRYPITAETNDQQKLARTCEWGEPESNFYIGQGQRIFISDQDEFPLLNLDSITFNHE